MAEDWFCDSHHGSPTCVEQQSYSIIDDSNFAATIEQSNRVIVEKARHRRFLSDIEHLAQLLRSSIQRLGLKDIASVPQVEGTVIEGNDKKGFSLISHRYICTIESVSVA